MTYQRKQFNEFVFDVVNQEGLVIVYFKYEKVARRYIANHPEMGPLSLVKTLRSTFE